MSFIRIGTTVRTTHGIADVVNIEAVAVHGMKYGNPVDEIETGTVPFVLDLSNGHWVLDTQVLEVLRHPVRSI
jgi:hypothetical protein